MRLFLAIELPETLRRTVARRVAEFRPRLPRAKWVASSNLHLTLAFLGETGASALPLLHSALMPVFAQRSPLRLRLRDGGTFPPRSPARVVWIGFANSTALLELQAAAAAALVASLGREAERRAFHPHLTLARCRAAWPSHAAEEWRRGTSGELGEPFVVERGVLIQSLLGPGGATYSVVETYPLEAAA